MRKAPAHSNSMTRRFLLGCSGASVVEYALLLVYISLVIVAALGEISGFFNGIYGPGRGRKRLIVFARLRRRCRERCLVARLALGGVKRVG
jgi:Flp pilus assembly pilin Flp